MKRIHDLFWQEGGWLELTACSTAIYSQLVSLSKIACALQGGLEMWMQDQAMEEGWGEGGRQLHK